MEREGEREGGREGGREGEGDIASLRHKPLNHKSHLLILSPPPPSLSPQNLPTYTNIHTFTHTHARTRTRRHTHTYEYIGTQIPRC
jgi:hypothetical protein